jgi:glutamine amidotransferase/cyclase
MIWWASLRVFWSWNQKKSKRERIHSYILAFAINGCIVIFGDECGFFHPMSKEKIYLLDYGAGNVRSIVNAISKLGYSLQVIQSAEDFKAADKIIFPGVGAFGNAMERLKGLGVIEPLKEYILQNRPFFGICVGMQCLFLDSDESSVPGLGIINGSIKRFDSTTKAVPHIGWNGAFPVEKEFVKGHYYFVHSYAAIVSQDGSMTSQNLEMFQEWGHSLTTYKNETFVSSIQKGNILATQFHPEKSGTNGLELLRMFLEMAPQVIVPKSVPFVAQPDVLTKRIIACLDVRSNDQGDLVVTKGDQYDVREKEGHVRNLGKPVELAERYYLEGSDEVTFLNITSFRTSVITDQPMLEVLKKTSERVFVPLTIGGGIRDLQLENGTIVKAVDVAGEYFRSGADKVSIGSDAVLITESFLKEGKNGVKGNAISEIAEKYGNQAVVISVDPKRVYVQEPGDTSHATTKTSRIGPNGEEYWSC